MAFTPKDWRNATTYAGGGDESTPVTAESLEDLETRVTDYTDDTVAYFVLGVNPQTTNYTLVAGDANQLVTMDSGSARTVTIPPNATIAFPTGTSVAVTRLGTGTVTLVAGAGVTLNTPGGLAVTAQYGTATAIKTATNTWIVGGLV